MRRQATRNEAGAWRFRGLTLWTRRSKWRLLALLPLAGLVIGICFLIMIRMPGKSFSGPLWPLTPAQVTLSHELKRDLSILAGDIGERNLFLPGTLEKAAEWIEEDMRSAGFAPTRQVFTVNSDEVCNIACEVRGSATPEEIVIVGAHYDSVAGCPGANDNGTGVVATMALARRWAAEARSGSPPRRSIRFLFFVNEEPPWFQNPAQMGSCIYAASCKARDERIIAMLSLETIGYYSDRTGSQQYPPPLSLFYPSEGNFIAFVSNISSRSLLHRCVGTFRASAQFPSQGAALPEQLPGVGWSDQWSFWRQGYQAVMITDTATFRYPDYHETGDTVDKVDFERMARVVDGVDAVVRDLANGE